MEEPSVEQENSEEGFAHVIGVVLVLLFLWLVVFRGCSGSSVENPDIRFYNTMVESNQVFMASDPSSPTKAIAEVTKFAEVLTKYDTSELSQDFQDWADRYESALYKMRDTFQEIERQQSGNHLTQVFVESLFRGYSGAPLGTARQEQQTANRLQRNLQQRINDLQRLNAKLDGLREKHGG